MEETISSLIQSHYFLPDFNAAIYDGAIRIHFVQHQEPDALKVYFRLKKQFEEKQYLLDVRSHYIFIMIYPNHHSFLMSFDLDKSDATNDKTSPKSLRVEIEELNSHLVVGIQGPIGDDPTIYDEICSQKQQQL